MTSGGEMGSNGIARRARSLALLALAGIGLGFAIVNALTELDERARAGRDVQPWEPWTWELSSLAGLLLLAPLVFRASQRLRPPRMPLWGALMLLVLLSLPFSAAHVAIMSGLRHLTYAMLGEAYRGIGTFGEVFVYEYRKDLLTYALMLLLPHLVRGLIERSASIANRGHRIEVRDGSRTVWLLPEEIDWAQAAGNYVELHGSFGTLLHRRTLAALEQELGAHGFIRIHRSRIVRRAAVTGIETRTSGDFDAMLASGKSIGGSRRFRGNLA